MSKSNLNNLILLDQSYNDKYELLTFLQKNSPPGDRLSCKSESSQSRPSEEVNWLVQQWQMEDNAGK